MHQLVLMAAALGLFSDAGDAKKELESLQGTFAMVMLQVNGEEVAKDQIESAQLVIEGNKYSASLGDMTISATITIDPSKTPKTIDFAYTEGAQMGQTLKGIYKLEGESFTMCRSLRAEGDRPSEFTSPTDSERILVVWKRSKHAAGDKEAALRDELAKFQGTWQLVSAQSNGEAAPDERVKQIRVMITGNKHTVRFGEQVIVHDVSFDIDPSQTPKQVTDTINEGPDKGKQILGIYKLDGATLTSCAAAIGKERPTEFAAKPGDGHTLRVFRLVAARAEDKEAAIAAELKRFEGSWKLVSLEVEGNPVPEEAVKNEPPLVLKGDKFTTMAEGKTLRGEFKIDPTVKPKTIDVMFMDGAAQGKLHQGIYELEGDTYKVCMGMPGKPRPTEFVSKPGSGHVLEVLKREKP